MNAKQYEKANIDNLTNLWKLWGFEQFEYKPNNYVNRSLDWPHRIWFDWEANPTVADVVGAQMGYQGKTAVFSTQYNIDINELQANGFAIASQQTAMVGRLTNKIEWIPNELTFQEVIAKADIASWAEIASQSFGYFVPPAILQKAVPSPNLKLILARQNDVPVASTLLFKDSGVVGFHLVGVPTTFRRRGFARKIMNYALHLAQQLGIEYATLQASSLGELLYQSLGFEKQFTITNMTQLRNGN